MTFWSSLSSSADADRDGAIDVDERLAYWQVALENDARYEEEVEAITDHLFTIFDTDRGWGDRSRRVRELLRRVRPWVQFGA